MPLLYDGDKNFMKDLISQSVFIRSLLRKPVTRTPVWLMRQAGRYLPEYQKTRKLAGDFLTLCKTPELACEVTLQPLQRFPLDAAILFSDILTIPDAMGLELSFVEGEGPCFAKPIRHEADIHTLSVPMAADSLDYVMDAVKLIRQALPAHIPLIGFAGSPWTLACYMLEGKSSQNFSRILDFARHQPQALERLLTKLTMAVTDYLDEQVCAGVNALMIFDTWGGILDTEQFKQLSLRFLQRIVAHLKAKFPHIPLILFTKGSSRWLPLLAETDCDALSLDAGTNLRQAREQVGRLVALQGNLDPAILLTDETKIRQAVQGILRAYGHGSGHVFNLGHGVTPNTPWQHVACMVDAVHEFSAQYHCELA